MQDKSPYPNYEDTLNESKEIAESSAGFVTYEEIGTSEEGRIIPLLTVTDPLIPAEEKSVLLVTGGSDGNEETGRAANLALGRNLLEPHHLIHLKRQVILIAPNVNPDGCVKNQAKNATGVYARHVYPLDTKPATKEGMVMRDLVDEWIPDAHVDCHGFAGSAMGDGEYMYPTVNHRWSLKVLQAVVGEMDDVMEHAGYPMVHPRVVWDDGKSLPKWLAYNHSSFCVLTETTEKYYPLEDSIRSALVRLMRLIEVGEEVRFFQTIPNYPCDVVSGNPMGAIMPYGKNYAERRKCRRDISQMIIEGVPTFGREAGDPDWTAIIRLPVEDSVTTIPEGMVFQATIDRRAQIKKVFWHDHELEPELWKYWSGRAGIIVRAEVPESPKKGENLLKITYDAPFNRHEEYRP